ncbi:SusD/RagB family nutrient-binding outer membrane lipoprotein, partial [Phocaeicola vulgatus]
PAGLMQSQDDNMKQTPKRQYIAGGNENIYALLFSWTGNAVLSKEMERAYKNQALKEGAAADAVTFNENSENCYLDPRCEVLWFRPTPFDSLTTSPLPTENLKRDFNGVMNGETNVGGSYLNRYSANRCILSSDAMNKDYWWNLAREIVWMGYAESLFLKAEAALRWPSLVDETAEALYLKGIKASMDYYEIDADKANEYISHLDGVKAFAG